MNILVLNGSPRSNGNTEIMADAFIKGACEDVYKRQHKRQYQDFVQAVTENRKPMVTGEDALESLKLIKAIYESSAEGKEVYMGK